MCSPSVEGDLQSALSESLELLREQSQELCLQRSLKNCVVVVYNMHHYKVVLVGTGGREGGREGGG